MRPIAATDPIKEGYRRIMMNAMKRFAPLFIGLLIAAGCLKNQTPPQGMILIPAGEFLMGSDKVDTEGKGTEFGTIKPWYLDEHPQHKASLPNYFIDKFEVTNAAYKQFVDATSSRAPENWPSGGIPPGRDNYPVSYVNWHDAERFCKWAGKHLPTEAEWEKAARGTDGRDYPWGNEFDSTKANTGDSGIGDLTPVGKFEAGKSPYGVYDMSGNVWEWTADWYKPYPGSDYTSDAFGEKFKILRGSSWGGMGHYAIPYFYRTSYRFYINPDGAFPDAGFRCAKDLK
jgi:formylglycine-generating enzyme required for sulfatase activity